MTDKTKSHSERTLSEWLYYLENLHHTEIDMGLERIAKVAKKLSIDLSFAQVITVAGTNGKGTTCAFMENALLASNRQVAVYSSPHIHRFNERLRLNKVEVEDQPLIDAFAQIEQAREDISLTYYEYTTLAAFLVLMVHQPEFIILEVGLGGRLDATNVIDADIAVLTTVDLDHQAFLGNDRESIGFEKAGIMRANGQVVIGDLEPPKSVLAHAQSLATTSYLRNRDFTLSEPNERHWCWQYNNHKYLGLTKPHIPLDNVATAIMVLILLGLPLSSELLNQVIEATKVEGRTEMIERSSTVMLDVGHNPLAARYLAEKITSLKVNKVHAVVGMLADKDIENTLAPLLACVDHWYLCSLDVARGADAKQLQQFIEQASGVNEREKRLTFDNAIEGYKMAELQADKDDLILVFGSFFTVAQVKALLN